MPSAIQIVQTLAVWALPVLFAITLHEVAHGWAARGLGDRTAQMMGRLSLNPVKHIDPVGTILVPALFVLLPGSLVFGWAKPVPIAARNLKHPRRDLALVAVAGPAANLAMALLWAFLLKFAMSQGPEEGLLLGIGAMASAGVMINLVLIALNVLPIPPLDGSRVLSAFLPPTWAVRMDRIEPYGLLIIVALAVTGILGVLMRPTIGLAQGLLSAAFGFQ